MPAFMLPSFTVKSLVPVIAGLMKVALLAHAVSQCLEMEVLMRWP